MHMTHHRTQVDFSLLVAIRTPSNFPFPLNLFIASDLWQGWTTRWDNVDVNANPIIFSQEWTAWAAVLIPDILILIFAGYALTFSPILATVKVPCGRPGTV